MLKRFFPRLALFVLATATLASTAAASPETAEDWGSRASTLYGQTTALLGGLNSNDNSDLEADYLDGLAQFSVIAGRLAVWVDTSGGAKDFGCIYRGIAEEAELQLDALETAKSPADAEAALTRIATMLDDAQSIAVASAYAARNGTNTAPSGHCPASARPLEGYLNTGRGS